MMVRTPSRLASPTLLVLLTLTVCLQVGAQTIPLPTADLLPTPDEVRAAKVRGLPCFPLSVDDGNWRVQARHLLPATSTVKYAFTTGDQTAQRTQASDKLVWRVLGDQSCSQRVRNLAVLELAAPPNSRQQLFAQPLVMVLTRYADPAHVAAALAERRRLDQLRGSLGDTLNVGDDAYLRKTGAPSFADSRDVYLEVQQGTFHILVAIDCPSPYYEGKLKDLMACLAEMIVSKVAPLSGGVSPPTPPVVVPAKLEITAGPSGNPNPVALGGTVQCSVQARHEGGLALSYQWTATGGSLNNPNAQNPIWTAPAARGATRCGITVYIAAPDGTRISASYLQKIGAAPSSTQPPSVTPQPSQANRVFIDGQLMRTQAPPTEVQGRVLVGLADIFRELGASVVWDGAQRAITATRGSRVVKLWIGRTTALVDGSAVTLDVPPLILAGGKTYVPVRFVSQALGAGVTYDASNRAVMITTGSMPPLSGSPTTSPYTPPTPPQGLIQISICRETGLKATGLCPNTLTRPFARNSVPGPCTTHAQGPKLIVTSPTDGATVPERFTISGTSVPGRSMRITVIAEATLKATGQNATSPLLENAEAKVGNDGRWSIEVNARAVRRDQRVEVKQFRITVDMRMNRTVVEQVDLVVRP